MNKNENFNISKLMPKADIVYFNGRTVKDRYHKKQIEYFNLMDVYESNIVIDFWDENNKILSLKNEF
jgi:hypothetical protein